MKKKILIIPSWYPSINDKIKGSFFHEHAKLVADIYDVKVLVLHFSSRPSIHDLLKTPIKTIKEWINFIILGKIRNKLPDEEVFNNPPVIEFKLRVLSLTRRGRYLKIIDAYKKEIKELIDSGWIPDLIRAHSVSSAGIVAYRSKEIFGIPYVISEHMPFAICNYPEYIRTDVKMAFLKADVVLSLSYDKVRQLGMSGIDVEPNIIYNYINEKYFKNICNKYEPRSILKLVSIGAASYYKDHKTLLRSLQLLKGRGIPFEMTLIGLRTWGELYDETIKLIKDMSLSENVTIYDSIPRQEVSEYLKSNNVFLMTSIQEGFSNAVLEALVTGLYVVATRHGGTEDILTPEVGSLVEIKNYDKIADILEDIYYGRILFSPPAIRDYVITKCGTEVFKKRLIHYYESAMNQK